MTDMMEVVNTEYAKLIEAMKALLPIVGELDEPQRAMVLEAMAEIEEKIGEE